MATPDMVDLHTSLMSSGIEIFSGGQELPLFKLHGNMPQTERTKVFNQFRGITKSSVLLCTVSCLTVIWTFPLVWVIKVNIKNCRDKVLYYYYFSKQVRRLLCSKFPGNL